MLDLADEWCQGRVVIVLEGGYDLNALGAYGDAQVVADSPAPREFRRDGARFVVRFEGVGGGLVARGDLKGFEVADAAGAWHAADAAIEGATVTVQAAGIPEPAGVRYAWLGFPEVTLFSKEGLPAAPFCHPAIDLAQTR